MTEPAVLWKADFDRRVKTYWIWQPVLVLSLFIVTIPIAILYGIIASLLIDRYLENLHCTLTERTLEIRKGVFNRKESTIPLDKITDLQLFQGPIMRHFELSGFKVETAGQSSGSGDALVNMIGIVDTQGFRKAVLDQRDRMAQGSAPRPGGGSGGEAAVELPTDTKTHALLTEIRDALVRIERGKE